jgi:cysteinyl-tRNA synthetase
MYLHNTYTKQKEEFKPIETNKVRVYSCGPTVYSHPHIGNFRSFIAADILCRYLRYKGYQVIQVMNITDVGHLTTDDNLTSDEEGIDKIQLAAEAEKKSPLEIARFYTDKFFHLAKTLNLHPASHYPRATEHILEMIELIKKLLERGYCYEREGNIYYRISKFPNYGHLSGNTLENLIAGARVDIRGEKENPLDFALWKHDPKHLMQWDSPWGKGFPGWHLECSAMSLKYLGRTFDIHTGGEDNIFPHHECEIAQSEAYTGQPVVRYWFHTKHLLVDNQKMSKSSGNFYTVEDILNKGYHPMVLRYALMSSHYRQQMNFTIEGLNSARGAVERLINFKRMIEKKSGASGAINSETLITDTKKAFEDALDDDLNISGALGTIFNMINEINKLQISGTEALFIKEEFYNFDKVLGILEMDTPETLDKEIERLIKEREQARENKDYKQADQIRETLKKKGIILEDTSQGTKWRKELSRWDRLL